jgi:hypothetical protein
MEKRTKMKQLRASISSGKKIGPTLCLDQRRKCSNYNSTVCVCKTLLYDYNVNIMTIGMSEGRMQAYGWSLPSRYSTEGANGSKGLVSVPVPIYCRPLNVSEPGMKVL